MSGLATHSDPPLTNSSTSSVKLELGCGASDPPRIRAVLWFGRRETKGNSSRPSRRGGPGSLAVVSFNKESQKFFIMKYHHVLVSAPKKSTVFARDLSEYLPPARTATFSFPGLVTKAQPETKRGSGRSPLGCQDGEDCERNNKALKLIYEGSLMLSVL